MRIKKFFKKIIYFILDYLQFIFGSAAETQIKLQFKNGMRGRSGKFASYSQLKKYQKKTRRFVFLVILFLSGMVANQLLFPSASKVDVYIPESEGDILISNIKKNGATVVFKTLDAANFNKPLATTATISVYSDPELTKVVKITDPDDYAVTHLIQITGLEENKDYYLKITATDSSESGNSGNIKELAYKPGKDNILKISTKDSFANPDISCEEKMAREIAKIRMQNSANAQREEIDPNASIPGKLEQSDLVMSDSSEKNVELDKFAINSIMHETSLYESDKVQAIISWRTNKPSSTTAIYREGRSGEEKEVSIGSKFGLTHMAVFTNFKPGTVYYFKVKSIDDSGVAAISEEFSFLTPKNKESIMQILVNNLKQIFK